MKIYRLPALSDNYIFLLHDPQQNVAAVVDPAEAGPVLKKLAELKAPLVAIFNTHHHRDHVGANQTLLGHFPDATVCASESDRGRIPGQRVFLREGDRVPFGARTAEVLFVPGHTSGHIAYYFPAIAPHEPGDLFCGDTLFSGGCGRLFEGTPAQMVDSLSKIRHLPDNTRVWCAHEYTSNNLKFALTVDPQNVSLHRRFEEVKAMRERQDATIPSQLGLEKQTNPFLRWDDAALMQAMKTQDPVQSFARLRGMKDRF
ncbi:hydroxyacylglutathione hydrolase [Altericista sp. CCNU0014]|uniref:hydroxyacylglutathione hydrolase n=1 Tax=Altericista sp. CCNU0014 TaxID=3082949 RepID=UPI00384D7944